jgi:hypothetical protein
MPTQAELAIKVLDSGVVFKGFLELCEQSTTIHFQKGPNGLIMVEEVGLCCR